MKGCNCGKHTHKKHHKPLVVELKPGQKVLVVCKKHRMHKRHWS